MAEKEEVVAIIRKNDYKEDLEAEVHYHTARINASNPFKVKNKYSPIVIPEFKPSDRKEQLDWELREIKRCVEGYQELSGRAYYFFNHVNIKHKSRGKIRPDFRATQAHFFNTIERIIKTPGLGLVSVKRRQIGASWMFSSDNVYDCQFNLDFDIGMNSKSETDSRNLFLKHKYIHRNQSNFLKSFVSIDRRDAMIFGEYDKKQEKYKGNQSSIISVAPTVAGHAGNQYRKLVCDEVGETSDFIPLFGNAEDCLMQDGVRVGSPFLFGTAGDMGRTGAGLMEFWKNHKTYNLEQFGLWGYNCLIIDELGNDLIQESVRYIIYERKRREAASKYIYNKFIQKYPLNEADAFLDASGGGVGDPIALGKQRLYLFDNPPLKQTGWMREVPGGKQDFVPDPNGQIIIYDRPDPNRANGIIVNLDPAEDDDIEKSKDTSELASAFLAKPYGLDPPKLVVEYCDRPKKLHEYYLQLALLLRWYGAQVHIELNKGGWRALDWFTQYFPQLLALAPASPNSVRGGVQLKHGVKMTQERKTQMRGLGDAYVDNYVQFIPSIKLIDQFGVFGDKGKDDDLATSFLWCLAILQGDRVAAQNLSMATNNNPTVNYVKHNGVIQLVTGNAQPEPTRHKSALFRNL